MWQLLLLLCFASGAELLVEDTGRDSILGGAVCRLAHHRAQQPNEEVLREDITQKQAFAAADELLSKVVSGVADIIAAPSMTNVDFEDLCTVMRQIGVAMGVVLTAQGRALLAPFHATLTVCAGSAAAAAICAFIWIRPGNTRSE